MNKIRLIVPLLASLGGGAFVLTVCLNSNSASIESETVRDRLIRQIRSAPHRVAPGSWPLRAHEEAVPGSERYPARKSGGLASLRSSGDIGSSSTPPPQSPGIVVGQTIWQGQYGYSDRSRIVHVPGGDLVHFAWNHYDMLWGHSGNYDPDNFVHYNAYQVSSATLLYPGSGLYIAGTSSGNPWGPDLALDSSGRMHAVFWRYGYQDNLYRTHYQEYPIAGQSTHSDTALPSFALQHATSPDIEFQNASGGATILHVVSNYDVITYWRHDGVIWTGPVLIDSASQAGHVVAASTVSDRVSLVLHQSLGSEVNNVAYYESQTAGLGWITGMELGPPHKSLITNYTDTIGPQAWFEMSALYDDFDNLHISWVEQAVANSSTSATIRHWGSASSAIRTVAVGDWALPEYLGYPNLAIGQISMGLGMGNTFCSSTGESNNQYLYMVFTQFGGATPEEKDDHGWGYNGELRMTISADGGLTWSVPENLTNSKTPGCNPGFNPEELADGPVRPDSVCRNDHSPSLSKRVSDLDILYMSGIESVSYWYYLLNPMMYLRLPGGTPDAPYFCPVIAARIESSISFDIECEFHAEPGGSHLGEYVTISNIGNAALTGTISTIGGGSWLTLADGPSFTIPSGGADLSVGFTMDATGLAEGLYTATIRITHNDATRPNPQDYPINFFVLNDFNCPQEAVISTGVE